ncbi:ABC transporter permease, partial [Paraburkholderia sp. SIMBA_027]
MMRLRTLLRHPLVWPLLTLALLLALDVAHRPGFLSISLL